MEGIRVMKEESGSVESLLGKRVEGRGCRGGGWVR